MIEAILIGITQYIKNFCAKRKARKDKSLVSLLCAKAKEECFEIDADISGTTITRYNNIMHLSPKMDYVICKLNRGIYAGENLTEGQRLTLVDAFHVPIHHMQFVEQIIQDKANWPQGVEYSCTQDDDWIIHISIYVAIDYDNKPLDDLESYFSYASELQRELHLRYNRYRETNKSFFD